MPIGTPHGTLDYKQVSKVTFVGASSNTVIDTTTGSLGVGVGVGGPTSNLHVVGNALITGNVSDLNVVSNVNMLHTANTAAIKLNSNVVAEFPRSKKLIKYPRVAMTGPSAPTGYVASASSNYEDGTNSYYQLWKPFDGSIANDFGAWLSDNNPVTYSTSPPYDATNATGNSLSGITGGVGTRLGAWLKLELPHKIKFSEARLYGRNAATTERIDAGYIYGSNDDTNWTQIGEISVSGISSGNLSTYTDIVPLVISSTDTTNSYKYFIVQPTSLTHAYGYAGIGQMEYYGTPEYDPEAHGTNVTIKSYPNVPNTDWLKVYYDGQDYTADTGFAGAGGVEDKAGGGQHGTAGTGVGFDTTYKAFTFDGSTTGKITGTHGLGTGTGITPTISLWFRMNDAATNRFFVIGDQGTNYRSMTVGHHQGFVYLDYWYSEVQTPSTAVVPGVWYHLVIAHKGPGTTATGSQDIYLNNVKQTLNLHASNNTNSTFDLLGNGLVIGSNPDNTTQLNGSIANFRIFNRALTSDEVYQLYAYQKEDFGHGDLSMTLKAGRLGIGTSEPKAALDVRGDIHGGCPVLFDCVASSTTNVGSYMNWNLVKLNKGGGLSGTTFTAPVKGHYFFHVHVMGVWTSSSGDVRFLMEWHKNGAHYGITSELDAQMYDGRDDVDSDNAHLKLSGSIIAHLEIGDTIKIIVPSNASMGVHGRYNRFTGHYIG